MLRFAAGVRPDERPPDVPLAASRTHTPSVGALPGNLWQNVLLAISRWPTTRRSRGNGTYTDNRDLIDSTIERWKTRSLLDDKFQLFEGDQHTPWALSTIEEVNRRFNGNP